ncbi:ATPase [Ectothiorhodospira haloalkaliphila]|uniref:ATPase n=1 Tax=Ectothiorhodospira TaxID=1051 RepID=UPI001EE88618|nr:MULTISPECIES: ATPase [Ectothiorhodospira]MCG5496149.1 ATPase [Ectothiorhodospira variabilis]MCG5523652.1 ATPase [Ectothiorhodospira haloalkaliphila]
MKLLASEYRHWRNKSITLLGMSGVGKTRLSHLLRRAHWFHYSGDYRIGTRYLDEPILDNIKRQVMHIEFLRDLLRSDSISIVNNLSVDNLQPVSSFLGKLGDPEKGGLSLKEFKRRQRLHHDGEVNAMRDVPDFIRKAHEIYGFDHVVNDAGGSVCELDDPGVMELLAEHSLIIYIKATDRDERELIQRAEESPKPLYYREDFLDRELEVYLRENNLRYVAQIDPDQFVRWMFPRLFRDRLPRYEALADQYGYTITTDELAQVHSENQFNALIEKALERQTF